MKRDIENAFIVQESNIAHFHQCCSCRMICVPSNEAVDKQIPIFYSYKEAYDKGWREIKDRRFCPPNKPYCYICPKCIEEYNICFNN